MEFKEDVQPEETIIQHEHPLIPEDLQSMYQNYVEDDDDFDDLELIEMQKFKCTCEICGLGIDWYHRHYYKCSESSCSYTCHKFCGDMPTTLQFPAHPNHTLYLKKMSNSWSCHACLTKHLDGVCYQCPICVYEIDVRCVTFANHSMIHHPGHSHPLIPITNDPTLSKCYSCGKEHKGVFYHCFTCFNFSIQNDCVNLPFKLTLAYHVHKLTLSYSFTIIPYYSKCRICQKSISETVWLYKCSKCRYYVHIDCAASSSRPFMFLSRGGNETNYKAADYPDLLRYPLLDESYNMLPRHIQRGNFQGFDEIIYENDIRKHPSHEHPLLLIKSPNYTETHDPDKRIKLVCNGCVRPITTTPFYECREVESSCEFYLHEWCTRLPLKLENHPGHPNHRLVLFHSPPPKLHYTGFQCNVCGLCCNGFGYACSLCNYGIDVHCAFIPINITHEAHLGHLLTRLDAPTSTTNACSACGVIINANELCFNCSSCDFYLDNRCALHLPKMIRHKYDRHPLRLSYSPIENHKGEYFCEVCEEELIPEKWFYHCGESSCGQSIHSACAPLILQSEQDVNSVHNREGVCQFLNMKFGGKMHFRDHEHVLSFLVGTETDGGCCCVCQGELRSFAMFRCFECKVAFHVKCGMSWHGIKVRGTSGFPHRIRPKSKEVKRHQSAITFYPSEVTRPIPWQPKDIDGQS